MTRTIGDILLTSMEDLLDGKPIPEFKCRRCPTGYAYERGGYCDACIEEIISREG